jgi:fatty acid desaturase
VDFSSSRGLSGTRIPRPIRFDDGPVMVTTQSPPLVRRQCAGDDYGVLLAEVRAAGLLKRTAVRYLPRALVLSALVALGVAGLFWLGNSPWELAVAAYSGIVMAQVAFLGHDAAHQQISASRRRNDAFGLVLAVLCVGLSYDWWVDKHNRHHRNPNEVGSDPDVERGILAWDNEQASQQSGVFRLIAKHEAGIFFPLLLLEGWNLHVSSVRALRRRSRHRTLETVLLVLHVVVGLTVLLLFMSPVRALEFVAIQQSVLGLYIGASFAPNHKGMPLVDPASPLGFAQRQVITSRNITGGRVISMLYGSLNYQIEHHLFPCMPSRNLARCRPIVKSFCAARSLPYTETGMLTSYSLSLRYLSRINP